MLPTKTTRLLEAFGLCLLASVLFASTLPAQQPMEDVVYLENGSVIRGTILEQTPGESLRIETRDGNTFVFDMEEVERITREAAVEIGGPKSPGTALTLALFPGIIGVQGVGQWYNGDILKGFLFFGAGVAGGNLALVGSEVSENGSDDDGSGQFVAGSILYLTSLIWSSIDAYQTAQRINRERGYAFDPRSGVTLGFNPARGGSWELGFRTPVGF